MAETLDQLTDMINGEEPEGFLHLTYSERIIGFIITGICAILAGILSIISLFILNLRKFSVLFTLSSILFFVSLSLLVGFSKILHSCSDKKRLMASIAMVCGMALTLFFGAYKRWIILSIVSFAIEILAFLYFVLSYIPGGERFFHFILF